MWKQILIEKYQAASAKLTAAEIALFIHGDPDAIDYKADSLQEQVKIKFLSINQSILMGKVWHTGHRQPREPFPTTHFLADILATIWPHIRVPLGKGASGKTGENPSRSWKLTTQRSEPGPLELFTGRWLLGSGRGKTRWCWWTSGSPGTEKVIKISELHFWPKKISTKKWPENDTK